jgi:hypothetical protein
MATNAWARRRLAPPTAHPSPQRGALGSPLSRPKNTIAFAPTSERGAGERNQKSYTGRAYATLESSLSIQIEK